MLPLASWAGLLFTSKIDYGYPISSISVFISFLFVTLLFVGWAPLVLLAGALALLDSPRKRANQDNRAGFLKNTI
ncbi:MAG: hypothetical protein AUJ07_00150 [Crenarchaeota archaeon 13_1_40CM_3_53_5]|nr:MAG: hypothetical protein AUJ07_00150 [Crenarchaeota archaeon 13_1_40CM_3_53_5]